MDDLVAFLRARFQEEAELAWSGESWRYVERGTGVAVQTADGEPVAAVMGDRSAHIARHDPARVLAEVEAKRRLMAGHELDRNKRVDWSQVGTLMRSLPEPPKGEFRQIDVEDLPHIDACAECSGDAYTEPWPCQHLRLLALPYRGHPGYRAEWTPEEE